MTIDMQVIRTTKKEERKHDQKCTKRMNVQYMGTKTPIRESPGLPKLPSASSNENRTNEQKTTIDSPKTLF
jgi:hypothetical protein